MVEEKIYNYLVTFPALISKVGADAIGWVDVPEDVEYPKIQFKCISKPTSYETNDQWQRWRFYISAPDKFDCQHIADDLTTILHGVYGDIEGFYFDYIAKIEESPLELRDDNQYEIYLDFRVLYHS